MAVYPKQVSWLSGSPFWVVSTGLLVGWDLGVVGVCYVELLILHELWAGERLSLGKGPSRYLRPGRPISVSVVPFGPGTDIWRSCRFIGAMMRFLCLLLGGLQRFVPCSIGANHCRLRHIGWEKCGRGLTSRPQESASEPFLNELLILFRFPPGSGRTLLAGTLPLRFCTVRFASRTPAWQLPVPGRIVALVMVLGERFSLVMFARRFAGFVVLVRDGKEFDLTENPVHTSLVSWVHLVHRCGRGCVMKGILVFLFLITRGGMMGAAILFRSGLGWGNSLGFVQAHVSRVARFQSACSCMHV